MRLPDDETFLGVLYLMWSANQAETWVPELLRQMIHGVTAAVAVLLIGWGVVWPRSTTAGVEGLLRWSYRFALCWPLLLLLSTSVGRLVANLVYAIAPSWPFDITPVLARLEGPLLQSLQLRFAHPAADVFFASIYSWVWTLALVGFGPVLALRGKEKAVSEVIVGVVLAAVLAIPFFVLLPVFDPWATNAMYGYAGAGRTGVLYLYPGSDAAALADIATRLRWAAGSCLPSLHVALPLLFALVAHRRRMPVAAWFFAGLALLTAAAVLYLGRHWIFDVVAAVPFALAVHWAVRRLSPRLTLYWYHTREGAA